MMRYEVVRQASDTPDERMCTHRSVALAEVCRDRHERRDRDRVTGSHYTARRIAPVIPEDHTGPDQPEGVQA